MDQFILDIIKQIGKGNTTNLAPLVNPSSSNLILIQKTYTGNVVTLHIPVSAIKINTVNLAHDDLEYFRISTNFLNTNKKYFDNLAKLGELNEKNISSYTTVTGQIGFFKKSNNSLSNQDNIHLTITFEL